MHPSDGATLLSQVRTIHRKRNLLKRMFDRRQDKDQYKRYQKLKDSLGNDELALAARLSELRIAGVPIPDELYDLPSELYTRSFSKRGTVYYRLSPVIRKLKRCLLREKPVKRRARRRKTISQQVQMLRQTRLTIQTA